MILCTLCIAAAIASAPSAVFTPTILSTEDTFDPSSLYTTRSDLVDIPGTGIAISHDEGSIAIESSAGDGGSFFYVAQQMDASGKISFVGLSDPSGEAAISTIYGTLMLQPDGSLRIEYDAYGETGSFEAATVTKLTVGGSILIFKANCDCESVSGSDCKQNECMGNRKPCDDDGQETGPWCVYKNPQVFVESVGN